MTSDLPQQSDDKYTSRGLVRIGLALVGISIIADLIIYIGIFDFSSDLFKIVGLISSALGVFSKLVSWLGLAIGVIFMLLGMAHNQEKQSDTNSVLVLTLIVSPVLFYVSGWLTIKIAFAA